jgi:hypothetical protein
MQLCSFTNQAMAFYLRWSVYNPLGVVEQCFYSLRVAGCFVYISHPLRSEAVVTLLLQYRGMHPRSGQSCHSTVAIDLL